VLYIIDMTCTNCNHVPKLLKGLTISNINNKFLALKLNHTIKWQDVIKASKAAATAKKTRTGIDGDNIPDIDNTPDAREEADRQNITRLAAISAKEGAIDAIREEI